MFGMKWHTAESVANEIATGLENGTVELRWSERNAVAARALRMESFALRYRIFSLFIFLTTLGFAIAFLSVERRIINGSKAIAVSLGSEWVLAAIAVGVVCSVALNRIGWGYSRMAASLR